MKRPTQKPAKWADHYTRKAQKEHYPARSVYKLKEIQHRHALIQKGHKVLDLGCAPGSWTLYAAELTGPSGQVVGVDLKPLSIPVPSHVQIITGDILSLDKILLESIGKEYNAVLSDMAPDTTGNRIVDSTRSFHLCQAALSIAQNFLLPGGGFICKIFQGDGFKSFCEDVASVYHNYKIFKPQSSRKASSEIYIIGKGKK